MYDIHTALKRDEIQTQATTQMNLEDILLSEISLTQKDKYCMIQFMNSERQSGMLVVRVCVLKALLLIYCSVQS